MVVTEEFFDFICYNKCKGNSKKTVKNLALGGAAMYKYSNGQISLSDFQQPMGMRLREDNRWVKKAQRIPWKKIEERYADLFPSKTGRTKQPCATSAICWKRTV